MLACIPLGAALAPLFVTTWVIHWGWRSVFYSLLVPGLAVAVLAWIFVKDSPAENSRRLVSTASARGFGLADLLKRPAVLWCAVALFFANMASWGLSNWLPAYLLHARGFSTEKMGIFAALPPLGGAAGYFAGGYVSDKYFRHKRHVAIVLGLIVSSAATYLAAIAPIGEWAVAALVVASAFTHIALAGLFTLPLVLVPQEAVGGAFGVVNTGGQLAGFLSPLLVGYTLDVSDENFTLVFYGFVGLFLLAAFMASRIQSNPPDA
jgi:nitrate/nitrite transporter NarK